jgi:hypothetical protein
MTFPVLSLKIFVIYYTLNCTVLYNTLKIQCNDHNISNSWNNRVIYINNTIIAPYLFKNKNLCSFDL